MAIPFDANEYDTIPQVGADRFFAFLTQLLNQAGPVKANPTVRKALKKLRDDGQAFQDLYYAPPPPTVEKPATKLVDNQVDVIVAILSRRTLDWAALVETHPDEAAEAERVHALMFPNTLSILKLPFKAQWAHCARLIRTIDEQKLEPQLVRWVGEEFLAWTRDRIKEYGKVLGITDANAAAEAEESIATAEANINDLLAATRRSLQTYIRACVLQVELNELPPEAVTSALRSMLELREETSARRKLKAAKGAKEEEKVEPKPVGPAPAPLPPVE